MNKALTIVRGVAYALTFVGLWAWLVAFVRRFDRGIPVTIPHAWAPLGIVIGAAGVLLGGACVAEFVIRGRGTPAPFDPPRVFVASGPYRYVRNPMYVGGFATLVGVGVVLRSPSVLLLALVFLLSAHLLVVLYEEPALATKFGDSYRNYRRSVHRWLVTRPDKSNRSR